MLTSIKIKKHGVLFIGILAFTFSPKTAMAQDWKINRELKFHLTYLPTNETLTNAKQTLIPALKMIPSFQPDITNIPYQNIMKMGFPLPVMADAEKLKLYLKLFKWPRNFNAELSSRRILDLFLISHITGGKQLDVFVQDASNVLLKYALIDKAEMNFSVHQPMKVGAPASQFELDSSIPFSTIYVQPVKLQKVANEYERAQLSTKGVVAVHRHVINLYKKTFHQLGADDNSIYFSDLKRCTDKPEFFCGMRIYSVPKQPMVFKNYRELPMPQDPAHIFLSSLLLIKVMDYVAEKPIEGSVASKLNYGQAEFLTSFRQIWSHVLEVGSVVDLRASKKVGMK